MQGNIVWLASYPKSGNTWMRSLITAYQQQNPESHPKNFQAAAVKNLSLNLSKLEGVHASYRSLLDAGLGIDTVDLRYDEIRRGLPSAYIYLSQQSSASLFLKTHDKFAYTESGLAIFPAEATRGVIHLVRDPRDVAVSAAHHWGVDIDGAITRLNNNKHWLNESKPADAQIKQEVSDWSTHTQSWLNSPLRRLTIRYEDMLAQTEHFFAQALSFCGEPVNDEKITRAVEACAFDKLKAQEKIGGFGERLARSTAPFFREGKAGGWKNSLTSAQIHKIEQAHGEMMAKLGYL